MNFPLPLDSALSACVRYILEHQSPEGYWIDWDLPPGPCAVWTTAYIGYMLHTLPSDLAEKTRPMRHAAAQWLIANEFPGHGWGYNTLVGVDADSTAHAILFLSAEGITLPDHHYHCLEAFQCSDGGFSTYHPHDGYGSWSVPHPDVTPLAIRALLTSHRYSWNHAVIRKGIEYLAKQRIASGLWNSFWWKTPLYGSYACLSLLQAAGVLEGQALTRKSLLALQPTNPFESALLLSGLMCLETQAEEPQAEVLAVLISTLLNEQRSDGSWNSVPILRVVPRTCFDPWNSDNAGALYADQSRLFTSATVLGALGRAKSPTLTKPRFE